MTARKKRGKASRPRAVASPEEGPGVAVAEMVEEAAEDLQLEIVAGRGGLENRVYIVRVQRPGLAVFPLQSSHRSMPKTREKPGSSWL